MDTNNISLLVVSCDAYSDLWEPAITLIESEWPDISFNIYWGSNFKILHHPGIKNISVGEDRSWCKNLDKMLDEIPTEYVIFMLEDFFLTNKADSKSIIEIFNFTKRNNIDCCRLIPNESNQGNVLAETVDYNLIEIPKNTPYRISTQMAIWKKSFLRTLLNPKFSAWEFEGINTKLVDEFSFNICAVDKPVVFYKHGVERGKWLPQGIENMKKHSIDVDYNLRGYYKFETSAASSQKNTLRSKLPEIIMRNMGRLKRYNEYRWMKARVQEFKLS